MSWLFSYFTGGGETASGKEPDSSISELTDAERLRNKQIESLRWEVLGVTEVERDEHYRVKTAIKGEPLVLDIYLPSHFPLTAPEVKLSRPVQHPWVRQQAVTDCPFLKDFSVHSDLGQVVSDIIKELNANASPLPSQPLMTSPNPPAVPGYPQPSSLSYQPFMYSSMPQPSPPPQPTSSAIPRPRRAAPPPPRVARRYVPPPVPTEFPDIKSMSDEELKKFLDETEGTVLIDTYVAYLDGVKKVQSDRDLVFQENENQAQINLSHEPELQEGWAQLQEKYFEMLSQKEKYDKLLKQQQQIRDKFLECGKRAASQLKTLAQDAETESEIIAEDFLDSKVPVVDFIRSFMEKRKLHHLRKCKQEKLTYQRR